MNPVIELLDRMESHLLAARVSQKRLLKLREHLEVWGAAALDLYRRLLRDIEVHEYREAAEIYALIPAAQWEQYQSLGIEDLREQQLLNRARQNLKRAFTARVLNHGKKQKDEGQPAAAGEDPGGVGVHTE